jgi:hypothetical protein
MGAGRLVAGRYRLESPVGRGAMGIVWRGRDELLRRDVAVKEVQITALTMPDEAELACQRALREARTAARLSHPGVVTVFDVVEEHGSPWIVMELIGGRSLDQVIAEDGPLPPLHAAELGTSLLSALATAHAAGVLHRDVKPSNVLITAEGRAILTDFGIATIAEEPGLTQAGLVVGTPGFTAPERVHGHAATPGSDLWSLGATLYAAVEGRGPFDRPGGSAAIVAGIVSEDAPRAPSAGPLGPVIDALLRRDPATRPDAATTATLLTRAATAAGSGARSPLGDGWLAGASRAGDGLANTGPNGDGTGDNRPGNLRLADGGLGDHSMAGNGLADDGLGDSGMGDSGDGRPGDSGPAPNGSWFRGPGPNGSGPSFLDPPVFAELRMPGPDGPGAADTTEPGGYPAYPYGADGPGQRGPGGYAAGLPESLDPPSTGGPPGPDPDRTQPERPRPAGRGHRVWSRGWRAVIVGAGIAAIVAATALGLGIYFHSQAGGPASQASGPGAARRAAGTAAARPGAKGASAGSGASGQAGRSGRGSAAGGSSPDPKTGPSTGTGKKTGTGKTGTGTGKTTGTGTGKTTGSGAGAPPAGYRWQTVTAAELDATAGFVIAAPDAWPLSTQGQAAYLRPRSGRAVITIRLTPFAYRRPVREAHYQQARALAAGTYPGYRLQAIAPTEFMGSPAASWRFTWKPAGGPRTSVQAILVTLSTSAGNQAYKLILSVPSARLTAIRPIFEKALATFRPLPPM